MSIGEVTTTRPPELSRRGAAAALGLGLGSLLVLVLAVVGVPSEVMVLAGVGAVGLGLLNRPRAATLLFIGLLWANVPVVAATFHGVPSVVAVGGPLLLLGIPIMYYLVFRRAEPVVTPALAWMIAYLAVQLISAAASVHPESAADSVAAFFSEGLILYLLVTNAVRDWDTLRGAVSVLLLVGTVLGGLSLFQELTGTYENSYGGFAQTRESDPLEPVVNDRPRLSGPIGEKNRYAQVMLILLPIALFAFKTAKSRRGRILTAVSGVAILSGMLLTFSRGAGVALVILVILAIAMRYIRLRDTLLLAGAVFIAVLVLAPQFLERMVSLEDVGALISDSGEVDDGAILGRATSALASLNAFADYPLLGVGPGQFEEFYSRDYGNELGLRYREVARRSHNMALEVAADTGVAGLFTLGAIFVTTLHGLWRVRRLWLQRDPEHAAWATAFLLAVLGYLLTALFLHIAYMRYLWLLLALANSVIWIGRRPEKAAPEPGGDLVPVSIARQHP